MVIQSGAGFPRCASDRWRSWIFFQLVCGLWLLAAARVSAGNFYAGTSPANVPWPGGIVPYEFTNTLTNALTAALTNTYLDGLREWELAANVKFVPHTNQTRWILFSYNTNFLDYRVRRQLQPANGHRLQPEPRAGLPRDGPLVRLQP